MIVAQDGSGKYKTIQEAINQIPEDNLNRVEIFIKDGVYKEKLTIDKQFVSLIGTHKDLVKITFDEYARKLQNNGEKMGTFRSYSTIITGDGFLAKNIILASMALVNMMV